MITKTTVKEMKDYTIEIRHDDYADNPLTWVEDSLKVYVEDTAHFNIGHSISELETVKSECLGFKSYMETVSKETDGYVFALVRYQHGEVKYYIGNPVCSWDSGYIGIVVVDKKEYATEDSALEYANSVMDELTLWDNGECYLFDITDNETEERVVCECGFIGYDNALECAMEYIPEGKDYDVRDD